MVLWMDVNRTQPPGSVVLRKTTEENLRPPLVPSERIQKNNAVLVAPKPRTREVTSRYKSSTPTSGSPSTPAASQRCPSPTAHRTRLSPTASLPKRSQSAERRRPATPTNRTSAPPSPSKTSRPSMPVHDIAADVQLSSRRLSGGRMLDGLWPSMRSLSSSFQSESISVPLIKKDKPISNSKLAADQTLKSSGNVKIGGKRTPSRGKNASDQSENLKPVENLHARVVDQHRRCGLTNGKVSARDMSKSMDLSDRVSRPGALLASSRGVSPTRRAHISDGPSGGLQKVLGEAAKQNSFDGSGGIEHEFGSITSIPVNPSKGTSSLMGPSRTGSLPSVGSPCSSSCMKTSLPSASSRSVASPFRTRPSTPSSPIKNSLPSTPSRSMISPCRTRLSTPSPSKNSLPSTPSRSMISPCRTRPSTPSSPSRSSLPSTSSNSMVSPSLTRPSSSSSSSAGRTGTSSSVLSYSVDVRKGKKTGNDIEAAHQLRLLYNRDMQWRFVNARAGAAMSIQKMTTENILYTVWSTTSEMRDSIVMKRINMQQLRQEMKLALLLDEQMASLEDWALVEREHCSSLFGAIEALKASTLQLPVTGGARADVHALKNAIDSAADVMQAMSSSIYHLLSRVESTTSVVFELAEVAAKERAMLNEGRELLASIAAMQVQKSSLRTHLLQVRQNMIRVGSLS